MKKTCIVIFFILFLALFSVAFSCINIVSPSKSDSFIGVPVILNWDFEYSNLEQGPVIYSIYIGNSQKKLKLYENNLLTTERAIFFLPDEFSGKLYWKVVAYNSTGIIDESEVTSFNYIKSKDLQSYYFGKPNEIKIVLSWEKSRFKLDLHLTGEDVAVGDIHMFAPLSDNRNGSPWPEELTMKSYRSLKDHNYYKEMTLTKTFFDKFLDALFRVSVESESGDVSDSEATVTVYFDGEIVKVFEVPEDAANTYWNIFDFTQVSAKDLRIDIIDKLSKTSSSLWTRERGETIFDNSFLPKFPPVLDIAVEADMRIVDVDDFIDILDDLDVNIEMKDLEVAKIILPQNVELDMNTLSVFVNDVACKLFVSKAKKIKSTVDIMFVVDRSGSMDSEIAGVQRSLEQFITHLNKIGFNARVGLLPYGSYAPSPAGWQKLGHYSDTLSFIMRSLGASAGGNEVPYTAINYVLEHAGWNNDAEKHIVLVTDEDSEENGRYESLSKSELIRKLGTEFVVHTILSPEDDYNKYATNYTSEADPREIAKSTNGIIEYTDSWGNVDLANSGILNFAENSYYVFFEKPETDSIDEVEIIYETNKGTGYSSSK